MKNSLRSCVGIALVALCCTYYAQAQNVSEKLTPVKIIGSTAVNYDTGMPSTTVNIAANAFDGDYKTYFASYDRFYTWAGADLGEKHIITKVAFAPRADHNHRLLLGVFEGANNPDFGDAVPLQIIRNTPPYNTMTELQVSCSRAFRYVRYIGPNDCRCNIAEVAFYGYKGAGDDSDIHPLTNLPSVVIHTTNAKDITSKEVYTPGIVSFISADGKSVYTDSLDIRGRGNNSWTHPKKPYRLKLRNKAQVLGNPAKEKNWTLINNYGDKTLMRNLLAFDLSKRLELSFTPAGQPVNVFLNGEFKGCYQLCDQIEVADKRVEVTKMKTSDTSGDNLTGGYLIEIDAYYGQELPTSTFKSNLYDIPVTIKYPKDDEIVPTQKTYIQNHFNMYLNALQSVQFSDPNTGYRKYLDVASFIRHFLVGEISGNTDTYWSVYMYKDRLSDQFFTGPIWDFDLAFDNDRRTYPISSIPGWLYASSKSSSAGGTRSMVGRIFDDPAFTQELKATYAYYRDNNILSEETLLEVVDNYADQLDESQKLNFTRWNIMNKIVHENPTIHGSYVAEVNNVRRYIKYRIAWMDSVLKYEPVGNEDIPLSGMTVRGLENQIEISGITQATQIRVYSPLGQLVAFRSVTGDCMIPTDKGIYFVQIKNAQEGTKSVKCVVR